MTLTPAYGRDYKSQAQVLADFNANKDFLAWTPESRGLTVNKEQIPIGTFVQFRYSKQTKVLGYQVK